MEFFLKIRFDVHVYFYYSCGCDIDKMVVFFRLFRIVKANFLLMYFFFLHYFLSLFLNGVGYIFMTYPKRNSIRPILFDYIHL